MLAVHSGAGHTGYAVTDRVPEQIAAMVYVDTGPGKGELDADFDGVETARCRRRRSSLRRRTSTGSAEEQLETFRAARRARARWRRARGAELTNDARLDVPSTVIATGFSVGAVPGGGQGGPMAFLAGLPELRDVTWVDLPTSHWPMWSRRRSWPRS